MSRGICFALACILVSGCESSSSASNADRDSKRFAEEFPKTSCQEAWGVGFLVDGVPVGSWQYFVGNRCVAVAHYDDGYFGADWVLYDEQGKAIGTGATWIGTMGWMVHFGMFGTWLAREGSSVVSVDFRDGRIVSGDEGVGCRLQEALERVLRPLPGTAFFKGLPLGSFMGR